MYVTQRIAAKLGRQYVMVRQSHQLLFSVCPAIKIGGRYYVKRKFQPNHQKQSATHPEYPAPFYWLLTNKSRVTNFEEQNDPALTYSSAGVWLPITDVANAHIRMQDE